MKHKNLLILILFFLLSACSDNGLESEIEISETAKKAVTDAHEKITKEGILADFIKKISENDFDGAIELLHPKLKDAWTTDRLANDWKSIREHLSDRWGPEATGSFSGSSTQGPYEQATYRLSSDWRSLSSVELVSMKDDGQEYIVSIHARVPYRENPPKLVTETVDHLTYLILNERYKETEELMTSNCKQRFPAETIKNLRPILGNEGAEIEKNYYRFCANTVWYDAVRLNQHGDGFTFLEFILSSENNKSRVATLTFRGKMR